MGESYRLVFLALVLMVFVSARAEPIRKHLTEDAGIMSQTDWEFAAKVPKKPPSKEIRDWFKFFERWKKFTPPPVYPDDLHH